MKNSPFKFLDPYELKDKDAFFGRQLETEELYSLVTKNRLTFVYGPSGTGKTSLVQCGLASRFGSVDWLPVPVRRGTDDINTSLRNALQTMSGGKMGPDDTIPEVVERLYDRYLRPVYLIFDQFEELFIYGSATEKQTFYNAIAELNDAELPCRILFIIREDYFGHLNHFEKVIPELFHRKLRVEPMSREQLHSVITGTCQVHGIPFDDPVRSPELLMENIWDENRPVDMPYVQVYLEMLYQEALQMGHSPVRFSDQAITSVGKIEGALFRFLEERRESISRTLRENPDYARLPEDAVSRVLNVFASSEGTKVPMAFRQGPGKMILLTGPKAGMLEDLPAEFVSGCILELEKDRILRRSGDTFEVAHDKLAAVIDVQRSDEERQLNNARQRIEIGAKEYKDTNGAYFFDAGQLARIEPFLGKLKLGEAERDFLEASRRQHAKARRRQVLITWVVGMIAVAAIVAGVFAFVNQQKAKSAYAEIRSRNEATFKSFANVGINLIYTLDHVEALEKLKVAVDFEVDARLKKQRLKEPLCELLYFFAEGGRRPELARTAAELLLKLEPESEMKQVLQECIQESWTTRQQYVPLLIQLPGFNKFQARYYPELSSIPLGKDGLFEMGSPSEEWGHEPDETLHQVRVSPYQIAVTPTTFYQFALYSEAIGQGLVSRTPYWGRFGDNPVVNVNWYEAIEYANWLNERKELVTPVYQIHKFKFSDRNNQVGLDNLKWKVDWDNKMAKGFRLPTEAEWELAARAGVNANKTLFAGSDTLNKVGWYWENSGDKPLYGDWDATRILENNGRTHPVKQQKKDNGIGIYDMSGNVWEWCWDWYHLDYYELCRREGVVEFPIGAINSTKGRVVRGGCWNDESVHCRVAARDYCDSDYRSYSVGFRLVFVP
jgi:formylglycine-generating enzyme required for sulfatase activity